MSLTPIPRASKISDPASKRFQSLVIGKDPAQQL